MVAITGITALIQGLGKAGVQTSIKKFSESMTSMEKTTKSGGMDAFKDGMDSMTNFATGYKSIAIPFKIMTTKFSAATTESSIKLMVALLELFENPVVQTGFNILVNLVNGALDMGTTAIEGIDTFFKNILSADTLIGQSAKTREDWLQSMGEMTGIWLDQIEVIDTLNGKLNAFELTMNRVNNALDQTGGNRPGFQEFG